MVNNSNYKCYIYGKKNIIIHIKIVASNNIKYHLILWFTSRPIVLIIIPTIVLIKNKKKSQTKKHLYFSIYSHYSQSRL